MSDSREPTGRLFTWTMYALIVVCLLIIRWPSNTPAVAAGWRQAARAAQRGALGLGNAGLSCERRYHVAIRAASLAD